MYNFEMVNLDLVEEILAYIVEGDHEYPRGGAILVFLPGVQEIVNACDQLGCKCYIDAHLLLHTLSYKSWFRQMNVHAVN